MASLVEVPVQITNNHVYVAARLRGRPLWLLVDTGAAVSLLSLSVAQEAGLPLGSAFAVRGAGAGSTQGAMLASAASVIVGGDPRLEVRIGAAMVLEPLEVHEGRRISGILGADFLSRYVPAIDYRNARLRLHAPDSFQYAGPGSRVPMAVKNGHPHVTATVLADGVETAGDFVIDVGSSLALSLTAPFVAKHALGARDALGVKTFAGRGAGGGSEVTMTRIRRLRLGSLDVDNVACALFGAGAGVMSTGEFFEGNIGGEVLRRFTLFVDYAKSQIIFEPNAAIGEPFRFDLSGAGLRAEPATFRAKFVDAVSPGSSAAQAGLQASDEIVSMNGRPASGMSLDECRALLRVPRSRLDIEIRRQGQVMRLALTLGG